MIKNLLFKRTKTRLLVATAINFIVATASVHGMNFTAVASGNWSSSATWSGGSAPSFTLTVDQVTIPIGINVTLDNNLSVYGSLASVNVMGSLSSSSSVSLSMIQGALSGSGSVNVGTISFATGAILAFTGNLNVNALVNSAYSLQVAAMTTVSNTLTLMTGVLNIATGGTINLGANSTIVINGGSIALAGGSIGLSASYNVTYTGGSATAGLELNGSGLTNVMIAVNPGNSVTLSSDLSVSGSLSLTSGTLILNSSNLTISGNISASGSGTIFSTSASNITISTGVSPSGSLTFSAGGNIVGNFTVNLSGSTGSSVSIGSNLTVNGTLNLVSGNINIESNMLQIGVTGSISGGSSASYVITEGGSLAMNLSSSFNGWVMFAVGTPMQFAPVSIQLNPGSAGGNFTVGINAGVLAQGTTGVNLALTQPLVNATWSVESNVSANLDLNLQMQWSAAMEVNGFNHANAYISHYTQANWDTYVLASATAEGNGMFSLQRPNIHSLSPFSVFDGNTVTGVNALNSTPGISVYPNPATTMIEIRSASNLHESVKVDIMNKEGQIVSAFTLSANSTTIPVDMLADGTYFIHIYNDKINTTQKLIKI